MKNSAQLLGTLCVCLSLGLGTGCDELSSPAPAPAMKGPPPATTTPPTPPSAPTDSSEHHGESASESKTVGNSGGVEREVAEVGVGKQGRNYGGGIVSEPIRAYFRTGQRLQLMQMKQALQHYKALHVLFPRHTKPL